MPKAKSNAGAALDALFKINKGEIINEPDTAAVLIERERLEPNPNQPRRRFTVESLTELGDSMKAVGQLQPIVVRPHPKAATQGAYQNTFQIVAGERRWRAAAAQYGDIKQLRCTILNLNDAEVLAIALSENAQREDISPIEYAHGLEALKASVPGGTWDAVIQAVAIKRAQLFRIVGLLKLPEPIQERIDAGELNAKHGRALLELPNGSLLQDTLLKLIDAEGLSGNAALQRAKEMRTPPAPSATSGGSGNSLTGETISQSGSDSLPGETMPTGGGGFAALAPAGQTSGSGFDSSAGNSAATTSRGVTVGAPQTADDKKKAMRSNVQRATSFIAETARLNREVKLTGDDRRELRAEMALLKSNLSTLENEMGLQ